MDPAFNKYLEKILKSEAFASSSKSRDLFVYLIDCAAKGYAPKEMQIAAEVFKRDLSENDQDSTIVRVNVHNLRKKLSYYYLTEGKNDEVQFEIPSGRYQVEISRNTPENKSSIKIQNLVQPAALLVYFILISVCLISAYFIFQNKDEPVSKVVTHSEIWNGFFDGGKKTMLVIGDYFFFKEQNSDFQKELMVRDLLINSSDGFDSILNKNPDLSQKYKQAGYTYTGYSTPFVLKELIPLFDNHDFEICLMSQFNIKHLLHYNIIFIGLYKTMGIFTYYFNQSHYKIDFIKNSISIKDSLSSNINVLTQEGQAEGLHDDYAMVAKFLGFNGGHIMLICSFHDSGIMECAKELANPVSVQKIENGIEAKFGQVSGNYEILFKVVGVNRNDLNSKLIHVYKTDSAAVFLNVR